MKGFRDHSGYKQLSIYYLAFSFSSIIFADPFYANTLTRKY
jgi:hypothetical protein